MNTPTVDVVIIGGGIAGVTAGAELVARGATVVLVEREAALGHHTTGRSAAAFLESYGNPRIQALTRASRAWYEERDLLSPRELLIVAHSGLTDASRAVEAWSGSPSLSAVSVEEAEGLFPHFRPGWVGAAAVEREASDIDVDGALQSALRAFRSGGGRVSVGWEALEVHPRRGAWTVRTGSGTPTTWEAGAVVDAAGAWADRVAGLAGARPVGLRPLRRTAVALRPPGGDVHRSWPLVSAADETWYVKPEGPLLLASPADETPSEPVDAAPEEIDVALTLERLGEATTLPVRSIVRAWAGLRTFASDRALVIGEDPDRPGFVWLAGQGGYGIQTAPAAARLAAAAALGDPPPADVAAELATASAGAGPNGGPGGGGVASLSPARFR